jgi:hypothetical protein
MASLDYVEGFLLNLSSLTQIGVLDAGGIISWMSF